MWRISVLANLHSKITQEYSNGEKYNKKKNTMQDMYDKVTIMPKYSL